MKKGKKNKSLIAVQEGKQEAEARGGKCLLIMGRSTRPICKHKNTSLLPRVESRGPLHFRNFLQLCFTLLTNACSQQDHDICLKYKVKLNLKSKSGPLPHVKAAALSWISRDWGAITVLIGTDEQLEVTHGTRNSFTTWASKVELAMITMPTKKGRGEKNTAKTLLWLHTAFHTSFNHNKKGPVQNNAMIECCRPWTNSTPIVHVRTAQ